MDWRIVPCDAGDPGRWSYGRVDSVDDLYSKQIFGPREPLSCACGKYSGKEEHVGVLCEACGVQVVADPSILHKRRMGHLVFSRYTPRHPLRPYEGRCLQFPIAPIFWRLGPDGLPNTLGKRYERLVRENRSATDALPDMTQSTFDEFQAAWKEFDPEPLQSALNEVLGVRAPDSSDDLPVIDEEGLLAVLWEAIVRVEAHASVLLRAAGLTIELQGKI